MNSDTHGCQSIMSAGEWKWQQKLCTPKENRLPYCRIPADPMHLPFLATSMRFSCMVLSCPLIFWSSRVSSLRFVLSCGFSGGVFKEIPIKLLSSSHLLSLAWLLSYCRTSKSCVSTLIFCCWNRSICAWLSLACTCFCCASLLALCSKSVRRCCTSSSGLLCVWGLLEALDDLPKILRKSNRAVRTESTGMMHFPLNE